VGSDREFGSPEIKRRHFISPEIQQSSQLLLTRESHQVRTSADFKFVEVSLNEYEDCSNISLYLVDHASFSNTFYFFTNLIHLVFLQSLVICLFVSTCFGPVGSSSGGSNA